MKKIAAPIAMASRKGPHLTRAALAVTGWAVAVAIEAKPDLLFGGGLFLSHSPLLGLHHDERHPHAQRMRACFHQRMWFQRSYRIDALVFHRFENLRLLLGEPVVGGQRFGVLKQAPAQRLAEA